MDLFVVPTISFRLLYGLLILRQERRRFTRGPLAYLLRNRFYIGEVAFKREILRGQQPPIIDRALFDAVQAKLNEQATTSKTSRMQSEALLTGRTLHDRGNRISPTHSRKGKYRYYLSSALLQGAAERAGSVRRVPAAQIDTLVIKSVRARLVRSEPVNDQTLVERHVSKVEVQKEQLLIELTGADGREGALQVPWQKTAGKCRREILVPEGMPPENARPIRSETRATLVASIARDAAGSRSSSLMLPRAQEPLQSGKAAVSER